MSDLPELMIGAKGENMELLRELVLVALDRHLAWRRRFHPDDTSPTARSATHVAQAHGFANRLRDLLADLLADAERGAPFFSPRHLSHMNADLLLPGLVGYFAAMLSNQNGISQECAPMTVNLERDVIGMLGRMVGYSPGPGPEHGGHLCSGGTVGNIFSLWLANNLRSWPLALRISMAHKDFFRAPSIEDALSGEFRGLDRRLADASAWQLWNLPFDSDVHRLRQTPEIRAMVAPWTLPALGELRFSQELVRLFPGEASSVQNAPLVLMAANRHYSFSKALDLLGLGNGIDGRGALSEIPIRDDFTIDTRALATRLERAFDRRERVLAVVATLGTTQEGALDDLPQVGAACDESARRGLRTWLHVDACYGGYLASLLRSSEGGRLQTGAEVEAWIRTVACEFGLGAEEAARHADRGKTGKGWLAWGAFVSRVGAMPRADSVSIDPHKLGYIPYPAGAVLIRDRANEDTISYDAPYLWSAQLDPDCDTGRHTLEGSRPRAAAAACWLAHRTVPLSQEGHGQLLAASILSTRELYAALESCSGYHPKVKIAFVNAPHTNIICYIPYHVDCRDLSHVAALVDAVATRLLAGGGQDFAVARTTSRVIATAEWLSERFAPACARRFRQPLEKTAVVLPVLRSVVMGPYGLNATTRGISGEVHSLFAAFAEHLLTLTEQAFSDLDTNSPPLE